MRYLRAFALRSSGRSTNGKCSHLPGTLRDGRKMQESLPRCGFHEYVKTTSGWWFGTWLEIIIPTFFNKSATNIYTQPIVTLYVQWCCTPSVCMCIYLYMCALWICVCVRGCVNMIMWTIRCKYVDNHTCLRVDNHYIILGSVYTKWDPPSCQFLHTPISC